PPWVTRLESFYHNFLTSQLLGLMPLVLAGIAVCVLFASAAGDQRWEWFLVGVLGLQLVVWALFTHEMPPRFIVVSAVPIALLVGYVLVRFAEVEVNPFRKRGIRPAHWPWGLAPAVAVFLAAVGVNLVVAYNVFRADARGVACPPLPGLEIRKFWYAPTRLGEMPAGSRILLVGDARCFYLPHGTRYSTVFDPHPLAEMVLRRLSPRQILRELEKEGITHIWINWVEIWRLAGTYGYPAPLSAELYGRWQGMRAPGLEVLDLLRPHGLRVWANVHLQRQGETRPAEPPRPTPPQSRPWDPSAFPEHWPVATVYALPPSPAATATSAGAD
ncbi:MAG TPA: hypothetical protein VFJ30_02015, partial [Phycisphaerae bacterium]|nr:hypothetical protein [Phycisphaerae bacterium]